MITQQQTQSEECVREIRRLIEAMMNGKLSERAEVSRFSGADAELMELLNQMLDVLVRPLRITARYIDEISRGNLPDFIIEEYQGEFDQIKRSLNMLLAIMYGMHRETQYLTEAVQEGKLNTRGNSWDYNGKWANLITGINNTLDAVIAPVQSAGAVLGRLAQYDLTAKMTGKYHGDHNRLKKALNSTGDALHSAVSNVSESVVAITRDSSQIAESIGELTEGATIQARSLSQTSKEIEAITRICRTNAKIAGDSEKIIEQAEQIVQHGNATAAKMMEEMSAVSRATQETSGILEEINTFSLQTEGIAGEASQKAVKVAASARGFSVVAEEVRRLARQMKGTAEKIDDLISLRPSVSSAGGEQKEHKVEIEQLKRIVVEIHEISVKTNFLSLNAAVEAAHVGEAVAGFDQFTAEVHGLSKRSKEAAAKTQVLTVRSVELAQNGEKLAEQISRILQEITEEIRKVSTLINQVAASSRQQAQGIEAVSQSMVVVKEVTQQNLTHAQKLEHAIQELDSQMEVLRTMVQRFKLGDQNAA